MSNKIEDTQKRLKELGYFASQDLSKIVLLFESAGKRQNRSIPMLLLQGKSGAGKTFLAETFSKMVGAEQKFVQCFPRMGAENFQYDVNIEGVIKQEADKSLKEGILLQALNQSKVGPVVLVIDELDKARPEVDSFLLDFLENGRLTTGTDTYIRGDFPIYTIITSNDKRELDEALLNRSKKVEISRPSKELFLEILKLPEDHYLGYVYDKCPDFSIRQARQYIEDLEVLGVEIDEDALSQYINMGKLNVISLADLPKGKNENFEYERLNLEKCYVEVNTDNAQGWIEAFGDDNEANFTLFSDNEGNFSVRIDTIEQLKMASEHVKFSSYNGYKGWFKYSLSKEEMRSNNIKWAENENDGTRFGIKKDGDKLFRIVINDGDVFVYLNSNSSKTTIEAFLGQPSKEYKTDSSHYDYDDRD